MKANELMVGDFVMMGKKIYRCANICGHTNDVLLDNGVITNVGNLSPIPLTPEILEKNGWEYNNYNNEMEYEEEYYVDENGFDIHINGKKFEVRCIDAVNIQLKYLHELQHILKLCGIEKTIEL